MGAPSRPTAKRARQKVLLINGGQHLCGASLECPVRYTRHAQRALLLLSGLRNIHSPNIQIGTAKSPAHKWRTAPVRRFFGVPGPLHKARPAGASPAFRASEYTLAEY